MAALQVLAVMVESGQPMSELARQFEPVPQLLENVRFAGGKPLEDARRQGRHRRRRGAPERLRAACWSAPRAPSP